MSVVLIVEDEPVLRSSVARGLAKLSGIEVLTAGTVDDALHILDVSPPHLVISDLDLPDGSGVELLSELDRRRVRVPVMFVSAYVGAFRSRIPRRNNVEVYEKPVPIERLRRLVQAHLANARSDEDAGEHAPFSLDEYLSLACMGRHSVTLRAVLGSRRIGEIAVWSGEVRSAIDARGAGPEAFRRLATAMIGREGAHLSVRALREEPAADDMAGESWQGLLFDAIRELDERRARGENDGPMPEPLPDPPAMPPVEPGLERADRSFDRLYEEGVDALLAKRFEEALSSFTAARALRPDDPRVVANVHRLKEMGYGQST